MKQTYSATLLWLLLCLFGSGLLSLQMDSKNSAAQSSPAAQATTLTLLNVRSGPGTTFPVLGQLAVGTTVPVVGRTPDGREAWWQIIYPPNSTQRAWIIDRFDLVQVRNSAQVPVVETPPLPLESTQPSLYPAPQLTAITQISTPDLRSVRFSPDGKTVATASGNAANFAVNLWRTADGARLRQWAQYTGIVWNLAFSPNGQYLASVADDKGYQGVRIWRLHDGEPMQKFGIEDTFAIEQASFYSVAFSPDGSKLAVGGIMQGLTSSMAGFVRIYETATWGQIQRLSLPGQNPAELVFSADGRTLVTGGSDGMVRLWRVDDWQLLRSFRQGRLGVRHLAISPDNTLLAVTFCDETGSYGCLKGGVMITRLIDGKLMQQFSDLAESVAFSPDGRYLVTGSATNDPKLRIRSTADWALLNVLERSTDDLAFSQDGAYLATNNFHAAQIWRLNAQAVPPPPVNPPDTVSAPQILAFTITPTTTQNFGDPLRLVWQAKGESAAVCRFLQSRFGPCQAVPLQGEMTLTSDETMIGVTSFGLLVNAGGRQTVSMVEVFMQCQNRYAWFFSHPQARCPLGSAVVSPAAFQPFEHGMMLWVDGQPGEADDTFYIFLNNATPKSTYLILSGPFTMKPGASKGNRIGQTPPLGLFEPVSGFGQLWRNEFETGNRSYEFRDLRARLGWALAAEVGYEVAKQCETSAICYLRFPGDAVMRTVAYKWTPGAGEAEWLIPPNLSNR